MQEWRGSVKRYRNFPHGNMEGKEGKKGEWQGAPTSLCFRLGLWQAEWCGVWRMEKGRPKARSRSMI